MERSNGNSRKHALEFLGELVPRAILSRARGMAEEIERDEYVRAYMAKRAYLIVLTIFATILIGLLAAMVLNVLIRWLGIEPAEHRIVVGLLMGAVLLSIVFVPAFFLIWRLEKNALREMSKSD